MASQAERALWAQNPGMLEWLMGNGGTAGQNAQGQYSQWQQRAQQAPLAVGLSNGPINPAYNPSSYADYQGASTYGVAPPGYGLAGSYVTPTLNDRGVDLFASTTSHPHWNPGEAAPPGAPVYARYPDQFPDGVTINGVVYPTGWEARYAWFKDADNGANMASLDPRWSPWNQYYQQGDESQRNAIAMMARGESAMPWGVTPEMAQRQATDWGIDWKPKPAEKTQQTYGARPWYPAGPQTYSLGTQSVPATKSPVANPFQGGNATNPIRPGSASGSMNNTYPGAYGIAGSAGARAEKSQAQRDLEYLLNLRNSRIPR